MPSHSYMGVNIYRTKEPGYRLPWYTIAPSLAADTLKGLKQLIKESKNNLQP